MDYTDMTNAQLAAECETRNLPTYGSKAQLIARLTAHDEAQPGAGDDPIAAMLADNQLGTPAEPTDHVPAPAAVTPDVAALLAAMQAQIEDLKSQVAKQGPAEPATVEAIAQVRNTEKLYQTEFPLYPGAELGEGLHQTWCDETVRRARAEGFTTRGGGRRYGWRTDDQGNRYALYEVYARK